MAYFRTIPLVLFLGASSLLVACNSMPAGNAHDHTAMTGPTTKMDTQMKSMRDMHEKMMNAKTPAERERLMDEHMKTMKDGMAMMDSMAGAGMGGDMGGQHQMQSTRMEMMQSMMQMMMDRLPQASTKP